MLTETLFLRRKDKKHQKKTGCKFIEINTSKRYDEDYETDGIRTYISKFKNRQKNKQKNKRTRKQNRKIDRSNHSIKQIGKLQTIKY